MICILDFFGIQINMKKGQGWVSIVVLFSRQMTNESQDINFYNSPWIRSLNKREPCTEILLTYILSSTFFI